jgi:hypothetical protein
MTRHWLAGAAVFAMMTGVALAQSIPSESATTTRTMTSTVPADGSYKWSETRRGIDRDGNETHVKRTHHSGTDGSSVTSKTRTTMPDGDARTTYHEKQTESPHSGSTTQKKTTTTTIDR